MPAGTDRLVLTSDEAAALKRRMGAARFNERLRREDTRELHFGGLVRWCPMKWAGPAARIAFRLTGLYGRAHREFLDIRLREERFELPGLPPELDGFTLLLLSDLHLDLDPALPDAVRAAVARAAGRYDAAVVTGDVNNFTVHGDTKAVRLFASIRPAFTAPVYGVLGNHDSIRDVPRLEREGGLRVLLNESVRLRRAGQTGGPSLLLAGVDDPNIFATHDLAAALRLRRPGEPVVLLAHAPSIHLEAAAADVSLVLCGHVHGGQICLPSGRTLAWRHWRFPRHVWRGRWTEGATQGYTTTGAGGCGAPLRLNCPPEIVLVRLAAPRPRS